MTVERHIATFASGLLILCCTLGADAADNAAQPVAVGTATEAILKMQREGSAAGQAQPVSGEVASRAYKRYLDSFTQPIRESSPANGSTARLATTASR